MHKLTLIAFVLLAGPALAEGKHEHDAGPALAEGKHEHDGLFLRLTGGMAYMSMDADSADLTIDGPAGSLSVALGGAVARNLVLYAEGFVVGIDEADEESRIALGERAQSTVVGAFGPGVTYYFMPINLYLGATLVIAQANVTTEEVDGDRRDRRTEVGPGLSLMVGKEWWASDNWAIGVAGRIFGARMEDENIARDGSNWRVGTLSVLFSATYN